MTAAIMGPNHMEHIFQQQTPRRMSGPMITPLKTNLYNNERRFSVQTPQCISSFPNQTLHPNNQHPSLPNGGLNNYYQYQEKKTPLRSTNSLPTQSSQHNLMNPNHMQLQRGANQKLDPQTNIESERYKTELCRPYEETGECRYGTKCQFAHGVGELRSLNRHPKYRTMLCRTYHTTGYCSYGQRCNFIHNEDERRGSLPAILPSSRPTTLQISAKPILSASSTGDSPASSLTSGSPSQSPCYLTDDTYPNLTFSSSSSFSSIDEQADYKFFGRSSYITGDELMLNFDLQNLAL